MAKSSGYWVELSGVSFNEDTTSTWIQALPTGTYEHPIYGVMEFSTDVIERLASNVNNNVRTQQLDIDYEHKAETGEAAGWVNKAEARTDGLWLLVDWTKKAADLIKQKAYRYFSPEFVDEWTHPKSGEKFKDVLFGGGITNRPFLKDILPMNMSDIFANAGNQPNNQEGTSMNPEQIKALAEKLGIAPDSTSEIVYAKLLEELDKDEDDKKEKEPEVDAELKQLAEKNPLVQKLMDMVNLQGSQLIGVTKQLQESDVKATVSKLSEDFVKKGYAIAPATLVILTKALNESTSKELSDAIVSTFVSLSEASVVALGEKGAGRPGKDGTSAVERFLAETKKFQEEHKLDFAAASLRVAAHDPKLFEEYQKESYAGRE